MTDVHDETARRVAYEAFNRIDKHEELCGERWSSARREMQGVRRTLWFLIATLVAGQGGVIALLVQRL